MDIVEIILLIIIVFLVGADIFILRKKSGGEDKSSELKTQIKLLEGQLSRIQQEQSQSQSSLRQEINNTVNSNIGTLGENLRDSMDTKIEAMNGSVTAQLDSMNKTEAARMKQFEERLRTLETTTDRKLSEIRSSLTMQLKSMNETNERQLSKLADDNNRQLEKIRGTVDEKLQETLDKKITDSFKLVSERLEQVYKGLGEMQTIAQGVGDLKNVLSNVKTRGILGEIQLGSILEQILAPEQYEENVATVKGSSNRVEFAVKLPGAEEGSTVYLPIDSKFNGDIYTRLQSAYESGDKDRIASVKKELFAAVKKNAKDIKEKYIYPPYTTQFGIMFLPFEGLYAEVVNSDLVTELQREYQVNIAGPSTMAAMLNSLQMGFRTLAIQKRSGEVWKILGAVKTEFNTFSDALEKTQKRLVAAQDDLEKLVGVRTRQINRKLSQVETLDSAESTKMLL